MKKYVYGMYVARGSKVSLSGGNNVIRVWSNCVVAGWTPLMAGVFLLSAF